MGRWEAYARANVLNEAAYDSEPVQRVRAHTITRRVVGTVLDVGGGDGVIANMIRKAGHWVKVLDISPTRVLRCWAEYQLPAESADATDLPYPDLSWDTVVLGEIVEHLENPGRALAEAFRVARNRVVVSLPLNGWADPTHEWRIRMDLCVDENQRREDPTKGAQVVLTFERGACWPADYYLTDPTWGSLFEDN